MTERTSLSAVALCAARLPVKADAITELSVLRKSRAYLKGGRSFWIVLGPWLACERARSNSSSSVGPPDSSQVQIVVSDSPSIGPGTFWTDQKCCRTRLDPTRAKMELLQPSWEGTAEGLNPRGSGPAGI